MVFVRLLNIFKPNFFSKISVTINIIKLIIILDIAIPLTPKLNDILKFDIKRVSNKIRRYRFFYFK